MRKFLSFMLSICVLLGIGINVNAENATKSEAELTLSNDSFEARSLVLMEAETGTVIYSKDETEAYSPASVTKIMTLLLVAEALECGNFKLEDKVLISEYAASMGGSQVFLEAGESMSVEELIKCTVIASANDAAVALAELVCGSESEFVEKMNKRAKELGLSSTNFENVTGLDDDTENHVTSARDIALMSRELIKYDIILKYSSLWQDSIRDGAFTLTNTNRLVRYYDGCNGLKTGSTDKAGYCISVTAKRSGMTLIAVVMGASSSNERNEIAKELLNYGFANFALYEESESFLGNVDVKFGIKDSLPIYSAPIKILVEKSKISDVEKKFSIPECISAPLRAYEPISSAEYLLDGEKIGESAVYITEDIDKITFLNLYLRIVCAVFTK